MEPNDALAGGSLRDLNHYFGTNHPVLGEKSTASWGLLMLQKAWLTNLGLRKWEHRAASLVARRTGGYLV